MLQGIQAALLNVNSYLGDQLLNEKPHEQAMSIYIHMFLQKRKSRNWALVHSTYIAE